MAIESLVFQNRLLNGAHSMWGIKLPCYLGSYCVPMTFSAVYPASKFVLFQADIHDVISTAFFLPPWFVYLPKNFCNAFFLTSSHDNYLTAIVINNNLKFCARRDLFADWQVDLFLLFFSTLVALNILILYKLFRHFERFFHVSIWVLPILGTHPFFRSNFP